MNLIVKDGLNTHGTHIGFRDVGPSESGLTRKFKVYSLDDAFLLGTIAWAGRWRKYVFSPVVEYQTIFEEVCMREIAAFIEGKTHAHRANRANKVVQI
jgi:hypothetical protein